VIVVLTIREVNMTLNEFVSEVRLLKAAGYSQLPPEERRLIRFAKDGYDFCPITAIYHLKTGEVFHPIAAWFCAKKLDLTEDDTEIIIHSSDHSGRKKFSEDVYLRIIDAFSSVS
jgi:hypothetical protein